MVRFDIGDDGDHRLQVQERGVALIGLGNQETAGAELGIGAGAVEQSADNEGRINSASAKMEAIRLVVVVFP